MTLPTIKDQALLKKALTHRSALNENKQNEESYERLEYLGDAVVELLASEFLYQNFPKEAEGKLTAYRSALVRTETLAQVAKTIGLDQLIIMGKGERSSKGISNIHILADVFESFIGALYLDSNLDTVRDFLKTHLFYQIDQVIEDHSYKDAKSLFQEKVQAKGLQTPHYQVISQQGPDHKKLFTVTVKIADQTWGEGQGSSKQRAQRAAAQKALEKMT